VEETLAAPPAATARAGGTLGGSPNPGDQVGEHGLCPRGDGEVATVCLRRSPPLSQGQKSLRLRGRQSWWGSAGSVLFCAPCPSCIVDTLPTVPPPRTIDGSAPAVRGGLPDVPLPVPGRHIPGSALPSARGPDFHPGRRRRPGRGPAGQGREARPAAGGPGRREAGQGGVLLD